MKSDVYYIGVKEPAFEKRCHALARLLEKARPFSSYKKDEFIPIKLTIGDSECVYHIDPGFVKIIVGAIKAKKAKPFLFDTNVIYKGSRLNAVDHLTLAQNKGFGISRTGAPFIIADGLFGSDGNVFDVDCENIKRIKIPSFIGMVDSLLVLSHVTGHIIAGFAGAIKNVAMGMSCRPTKQIQHSSIKPTVLVSKCTSCGVCVKVCPVNAISLDKNDKAYIDPGICIGCGECLAACKFYAISVNWDEDPLVFAKRVIDTAKFILSRFKNTFFINFAFDITKECDCISTKGEKIITPNIGILASRDALSLDKATLDIIGKEGPMPFRKELLKAYVDSLKYASQKKLGNLDYNLIDVS